MSPVMFIGWNGPASSSPGCGPDEIFSLATIAPANRANTANDDAAIRSFDIEQDLLKEPDNRLCNSCPGDNPPVLTGQILFICSWRKTTVATISRRIKIATARLVT